MTDQEAEDQSIAPEAEEAKVASRRRSRETIGDVRRMGANSLVVVALAITVVTTIAFSLQTGRSADQASKSASLAADSAALVVETNNAAACRAAYNAVITDARVVRESETALVITLLAEGLRASVVDDPDYVLLDLAVQLDDALAALDRSGFLVETANNEYQAVVVAQREDPDLFQELCDAGPYGDGPGD